MKNFLPPMGEGEDEETMTEHEKRLQHQSQLSIEKQDKLVVKRLLDLTYLKRRKLLVTDCTKILDKDCAKPLWLYLHSSNSLVY